MTINREMVLANVIPCLAHEVEEKSVVKTRWLDLDLFFRISFGNGRYAKVTSGLMDMYQLTLTEITAHAMDNLKNKCVVQTLEEKLKEMGMRVGAFVPTGLIVMTTDDNMFGAGTMLLTDELNKIMARTKAKMLYVIPSSIHEILVLPNYMEEEEVNDLITSVNEEAVTEEERLSNHVYKYMAGDVSVRM